MGGGPDDLDLPTVQLLHVLPDGSRHVDWLLGQDPEGTRPLIAFRIERRVDELSVETDALLAQRMADHRAVYLTFEGPLAAAPGGRADVDRGSVSRLVGGRVHAWARAAGRWDIAITWDGGGAESAQRLRLDEQEGGNWVVRALS
jgi:hypothetical protein